MKTAAVLLPLIQLASAVSLCDQYAYYDESGYNFNNDEWNLAAGTGSGCVYIDDVYTTGVIFHVAWNWAGSDNSVKAYPNTGLDITKGQLLSSISTMPTEVYWSYTGSSIRADVSYDLFSASDPNHDTSYGDYELMIWLAALGGVEPLGSKIASSISVGGLTWDLWYGTSSNGQQTYSFEPTNGNYVEAFTGQDIKSYWNYLRDNHGYPASSQYLLTVQFGTEPFTGSSALFNVTWFTAAVN